MTNRFLITTIGLADKAKMKEAKDFHLMTGGDESTFIYDGYDLVVETVVDLSDVKTFRPFEDDKTVIFMSCGMDQVIDIKYAEFKKKFFEYYEGT